MWCLSRHAAAFGTAVGRGTEVVAAAFAEADSISAARAEDRAKADAGARRREGEEPVGEIDDAGPIAKVTRAEVGNIAEAEEPDGPSRGI